MLPAMISSTASHPVSLPNNFGSYWLIYLSQKKEKKKEMIEPQSARTQASSVPQTYRFPSSIECASATGETKTLPWYQG